MTNTFWLNNPAILFDSDHITEIWPSSNLDYISKLNAVTRLSNSFNNYRVFY